MLPFGNMTHDFRHHNFIKKLLQYSETTAAVQLKNTSLYKHPVVFGAHPPLNMYTPGIAYGISAKLYNILSSFSRLELAGDCFPSWSEADTVCSLNRHTAVYLNWYSLHSVCQGTHECLQEWNRLEIPLDACSSYFILPSLIYILALFVKYQVQSTVWNMCLTKWQQMLDRFHNDVHDA